MYEAGKESLGGVATRRIQRSKDPRGRVCGYMIERSLKLLGSYGRHGLVRTGARSEDWACGMRQDNESELCCWLNAKGGESDLFFPFGFPQIDFSQIHEGNLFHIRI